MRPAPPCSCWTPVTRWNVSAGTWLAIDTTTDIASVAAGRRLGAGTAASDSGAHVQGARRHAAEIVRLSDFALGRIGVSPRDLDGVVVGDGSDIGGGKREQAAQCECAELFLYHWLRSLLLEVQGITKNTSRV